MSNYDWFRPSQQEIDAQRLKMYEEKERLEKLREEGFVETTLNVNSSSFSVEKLTAKVLMCVYCGGAVLDKELHRKNTCP